jgi:hypothetical protein
MTSPKDKASAPRQVSVPRDMPPLPNHFHECRRCGHKYDCTESREPDHRPLCPRNAADGFMTNSRDPQT